MARVLRQHSHFFFFFQAEDGIRDLTVDWSSDVCSSDLVGSNDGTLLSNFHKGGHRVRGIEPSLVGKLANERGISTWISFFGRSIATRARNEEGQIGRASCRERV